MSEHPYDLSVFEVLEYRDARARALVRAILPAIAADIRRIRRELKRGGFERNSWKSKHLRLSTVTHSEALLIASTDSESARRVAARLIANRTELRLDTVLKYAQGARLASEAMNG